MEEFYNHKAFMADKTSKTEQVHTPFFGARCSLEISGMKAEITKFLQAQIGESLEPAIHKAIEKTFSKEGWEHTIESEVEASLKKLIHNTVKDAIEDNYDLRRKLVSRVNRLIMDNAEGLISGALKL